MPVAPCSPCIWAEAIANDNIIKTGPLLLRTGTSSAQAYNLGCRLARLPLAGEQEFRLADRFLHDFEQEAPEQHAEATEALSGLLSDWHAQQQHYQNQSQQHKKHQQHQQHQPQRQRHHHRQPQQLSFNDLLRQHYYEADLSWISHLQESTTLQCLAIWADRLERYTTRIKASHDSGAWYTWPLAWLGDVAKMMMREEFLGKGLDGEDDSGMDEDEDEDE